MDKIKRKKIKYGLIALILFVLFASIPNIVSLSRYKYSLNMTIGMDQKVNEQAYSITYILNGGTQEANAPTSIMPNETVNLPTPTKENSVFLGWYDNENFTGSSLTTLSNVTSNVTLYAKWTLEYVKVTYYFGDNIEFDGKGALDTTISFFSQSNLSREMELTVDIDEHTYLTGQSSGYNTFFNCTDHDNSPWPGFTFRANSSKYFLKTSNVAGTSRRKCAI